MLRETVLRSADEDIAVDGVLPNMKFLDTASSNVRTVIELSSNQGLTVSSISSASMTGTLTVIQSRAGERLIRSSVMPY